MAEKLLPLATEQITLLTSLEKSLARYKSEESGHTESHLEARLDSIAHLHADFQRNHHQLIQERDNAEIKGRYFDKDIRDCFEETYIMGVAEIRNELQRHKDRRIPASTAFDESCLHQTVHEQMGPCLEEVKLPTVKLPTFSGKFIEWPAFKEVFLTRVHHCDKLTDLHRFHYLKDSLVGDAAKDIEHLTLIAANYEVAWRMLINLYDNNRVLFLHYMDVFDQQLPIKYGDAESLRRFVQTSRSCVNSLEKTGVDVRQQSEILVYYMMKRLPNQLRVDWERSISSTQNLPSFEELSQYLETQYRTMITASAENAAQQLRLRRKQAHITITGLADTKITDAAAEVELVIRSIYNPHAKYKLLASVIPLVSKRMPIKRLPFEEWTHLKGLPLADPNFFSPQGVDILLGNDVYDELMLGEVHRGIRGMPLAQNTHLGYIVSGKTNQEAGRRSSYTITVRRKEADEILEQLLCKFWELEQFDEEPRGVSVEDNWCEDFFVKTHSRMPSGKYVVRLPFLTYLDESMVIGESYKSALKRLHSLNRRLRNDASLKNAYVGTINEYLELGQMERVTSRASKTGNPALGGVDHCYLPHHPVIKESSSTTKVRVVFDGSSKTSNGKSLNEILAIGPKLHVHLQGIILNWRGLKWVFMADVEKMYRCINIPTDDAQYQRILWNPDTSDYVEEYACTTVMFGTSSAPYLAMRVMKQLAMDEYEKYPLAVDVINHQMYVDDILSGGDSIAETEDVKNQVIGMLRSGTFELRKWASNCTKLLENIPVEHRESSGLLHMEGNDTIRTLGLYWSPKEDEFRFALHVVPPMSSPTKGTILSAIARLFDPMGLLSPIMITAKILMQQLGKEKIGWDSTLPDTIKREWEKFVRKWECYLQYEYALLEHSHPLEWTTLDP
ncbi:uncharacterized protein [Drosophila tropicalis]|uniref:uncharacterized protein n=1 Tax=Drosophila tropicalis TaxID=46794 RepID=UPI0035AC0ABC